MNNELDINKWTRVSLYIIKSQGAFKVRLHWGNVKAKVIFFFWPLSLFHVNIKLDFLWNHLEVTSFSLSLSWQYKRTLTSNKGEHEARSLQDGFSGNLT